MRRLGAALGALLVLAEPVPLTAQGIALTRGTPASVGLDPAVLGGADSAAARLAALTSLAVWRRGAIGYERYQQGGALEQAVNVKSVAKSILGMLVGIALEQRRIASLDGTIADVLPEYYSSVAGTLFPEFRAQSDTQRRSVTWRHLLTMTSGVAWDESNAELTYALLLSGNPVRFAAELPVLGPPGARFNYGTAGTHLLAGALARGTGESHRAFAERQLLKPAGITLARWDADPQGVEFGGSEMYLTTRDMLRLGILILHQGRVGDTQVVPLNWVTASTTKHATVEMPVYQRMIPNLTGYGYLWWLRNAGGHVMACALGLGGQFILVVPGLDLVVAGTSALDMRNPGNEAQFNAIFDLVDRTIVAAAR